MKSISNTNYTKNLAFTFFALFAFAVVSAQDDATPDAPADADEKKKIELSGSLDAYFRTNLTGPNGAEAIAPNTSFANLNGFALGFANLIASYEADNVGAVADLVFGPRGTDAIFGSPQASATGNIINQLYVYWNVSEGVTLTLGNFNTFLGYEVISPTANFNYSTSYLFSFGPFSHTGLKADFDLGNDWSAMAAILNPTDLTEFNPNDVYFLGGQLGYKGQYLNVLFSGSQFEIDYTGGFQVSDDFFLGINGAFFNDSDSDSGFAGVAVYPQLSTSDTFSIGLRGEFFTDINAFDAIGTGIEDASVFAATLTGNIAVGNLTIKPELRFDTASDNAFVNADLDPTSSLVSFLVAGVFSFD